MGGRGSNSIPHTEIATSDHDIIPLIGDFLLVTYVQN